MSDIIITPNRGSANAPTIQFSGSANASASIRLEVLPEGQVAFLGKSGSLFSISDNMVGSLMAVGDISGLPILEVFSNDKVVMGQFNKNTLVVTGSRVGVGKSNPTVALDVSGSIAITGSMAVSGDATFAGNIAVNGTSASTMGGYLAAAKGFAATSTAGNPVITANEVLLDYSSGGRIVTVGPSAAAYNSFTIRQVDNGNANPVTAFQIDASSNATFAGSVQVANAIISSNSGHAYITGPTTAGKFLTLQSGNTTGGINFRDSNSNSVGQYYQDTDAWSFAKSTSFGGTVTVAGTLRATNGNLYTYGESGDTTTGLLFFNSAANNYIYGSGSQLAVYTAGVLRATIASTGATFAGAVSGNRAVSTGVANTNGDISLTINGNSQIGTAARWINNPSSDAHNWQLGTNLMGNWFSFMASTVVDGTTFSTDALKLTNTGAATFAGTGAFGGAGTLGSTYLSRLSVFTAGAGNFSVGGQTNTNNTVVARMTAYNASNGNSGNEASTAFMGIASIESVVKTATSNAGGDSGGDLVFLTKGDGGTLTERMRLLSTGAATFGGAVSVGTGAAVGGATAGAGGLAFPATAVAVADANTLDDYEEGTWTPTDDSGAALSFTVYNATYTKIGRLVEVEAAIYFPSTANTAAVRITGLPFTAAGGDDNTGGLSISATNVGANYYMLITRGSNTFTINTNADVGVTNATYSLKFLKFFGWYHV